VSRAVCRTCWTWYGNGETVCPKCRTRLVGADVRAGAGVDAGAPTPIVEIPPAGLVQPTVDAPFPGPAQPNSSLSGWQWWLIGRAALAAVVVATAMVSGLFVTGVFGPVKSSDGAFSVRVPTGWAVGQAPAAGSGKPVLALARLETTAGVESHFIVEDFGQFVPLRTFEESWQLFIESGQSPVAGNFGPLTRTTVAGAPALTADYQGSKYGGQLMFVDYGSKTYLIEMSSDPSEFAKLRDSDYAAILSSWQWH
jgi:hypothetical protein